MNIIETMKQALEALTNPAAGYEDHFSAITNLRAAIDAVEKQDPLPGMSSMNRAIAYSAANKLRELGFIWAGSDWEPGSKSYLIDPNCKCDEHGACSYCWEGKKQK